MRKTTFFWVFIFIQTLGFSASARGRIVLADSSKFQTISNLVYGNAPDHRNELDIYLPKKHGAKTPMVVFNGSDSNSAKYNAVFSIKKSNIESRYGPFYYFTDLYNSMRYACYDVETNEKNAKGGFSCGD